jgi:hypothetical protein
MYLFYALPSFDCLHWNHTNVRSMQMVSQHLAMIGHKADERVLALIVFA